MVGKQYLVELSAAGFPVIPTMDSDPESLLDATSYMVKPKLGSDSIGLRRVTADELAGLSLDGLLAQPLIDFRYEVSFYFVDRDFQYALYTPDPDRRRELDRYTPSAEDLAFAQRFVDWRDRPRDPAGGCLPNPVGRPPAARSGGPEPIFVARTDR